MVAAKIRAEIRGRMVHHNTPASGWIYKDELCFSALQARRRWAHHKLRARTPPKKNKSAVISNILLQR
jgi:hypothetical protein